MRAILVINKRKSSVLANDELYKLSNTSTETIEIYQKKSTIFQSCCFLKLMLLNRKNDHLPLILSKKYIRSYGFK